MEAGHLSTLSWPAAKLGEALEALARRSALSLVPEREVQQPGSLESDYEALNRFVDLVAERMNIEAKSFFCTYSELERVVIAAGPALLRFRTEGEVRFLALIRANRRFVHLLSQDSTEHRVRTSVLTNALRADVEAPFVVQTDTLLSKIGISRRKCSKVRKVVLRELLSAVQIDAGWLLTLAPGTTFDRQLRRARVFRDGIVLVAAHTCQYAMWLAVWSVLGLGALQGRFDYGWLAACGLLLTTIIPLRLLTAWKLGTLSINAGGLLRQRLLYGALCLEPDETSRQGMGQLLGRIIETDVVESLVLRGGFLSLLAIIELSFATWVLANGSAGWKHSLLLMVWIALTSPIIRVYFNERQQWTQKRLEITNDLVERMIGHRTRLAQEPRKLWHQSEDRSLSLYHLAARRMDRASTLLAVFVPRGWLVTGMAALAWSFIYGGSSQGHLAVALGGVLLAYAALRRLSAGVAQLSDAAIAWRQVAPVFQAAELPPLGRPSPAASVRPRETQQVRDGELILEARDLVFRYRDRGEPALKGCNVSIRAGDKILLEGHSGSGKSSLAAVLAGLRRADSGLLLLRGFDRPTLGDLNWKRMLVLVPQFHENYVITGTMAFNCLLGARWPARPEELEKAERICRELGLGELIDRMPSGMFQMVGETGWQLSHGERSRLYIARAILQDPDIVVLDESFAALDPESLRRALTCVLNRAPTVMIIAHP